MDHPVAAPSLPARLLAGIVRGYQLIVSPWRAPSCRYYPSCSAYGIEALRTHGAIRGLALTGWRLLRCNPWSRGGVDHVPPPGQWRDAERESRFRGVPEDGAAHSTAAEAVPSEPGPRARPVPERAHRHETTS